jgi:uncharacterized repeat protein (TIGR03803 family)
MTRFEVSSLACVLCAATAIISPGQTFKTMASFDLHVNDGYPQYMSLVQGNDGDLYGTTPADSGTVFKITTAGELTVVCYFGESLCPGGAFPFAGLILAADGNFYGTAWQGNASGSNTVYGAGTVFEITAGGQPITLYGFCSQTNCTDGDDPFAPLIQAANHNFYGTTLGGGTNGYGTVFEITSGGALTTLHSFRYTDGASPTAGLIQAKNRIFYGTTLYGGTNGAGTVFEITAGGKLRTLHSFGSAGDGANPYAGLAQAKNGNLYGTTYGGGAHGHGTVFEITTSGKLTILYSFCSQTKCADGANPFAGVIQAADGNFYGTASGGGASNWGTVFEITPGGKLTTLHSFCSKENCTDGAGPSGGLIQAASGTFYGTTTEGGAYENGTVFSLSPGLVSSAEAEAASAQAETAVIFPRADLKRTSGHFFARRPYGQSVEAPGPVSPDLNCSPAPCVLPPTQASEGGNPVTDTPIVSNPLNPKHLLLGSVDGNCPPPSVLGFHLSTDGGSTWNRTCMPSIITQGRVYYPLDEPLVGYDRNGAAYIAGLYFDSQGQHYGFVAFQKSTDGTHWSKPRVALRKSGRSFPYDTSMAVDTSPDSPRVNSLYLSGVMASPGMTQILVSHSTDGGATWTQAAVDSAQKYPADHDFTRITVGKDGAIYVTWLYCVATGPHSGCGDGVGQMMFSKSTDGGNTWSPPRLMAEATFYPPHGLPNTNGVRVYNYPVIGVDNSNGSHAGNLYVVMNTWTGTYLRVQVIRSTDGGNTWSKPVPVAPASDTHDQFFPSLSVSPTGKVGVSWLDRRNDPANIDYQAFAAISSDGGRSFQPNWQLTKAFSNPDTNGGNNWMGDYTGNAWAGGDFIAAWMDSSNGVDMQEVIGGIRLH